MDFPRFPPENTRVISGFNTDIECNGTVYHVQTEDKGAPAHMIMSLVYDKGTILASKRSKYDDLDVDALDESEIADRLSRQHKLMCAAVKAGRINELVAMTRKASSEASAARSLGGNPVATAETVSTAIPKTNVVPLSNTAPPPPNFDVPPPQLEVPANERPALNISFVEPEPHSEPASSRVDLPLDDISFADLPILEAEIIEDIEILPAEAVEVVSELSGQERPVHHKLCVEILGESKFKGGERKTLNIMLTRGTDRKIVKDAQILVKILGSAFRPVIFHAKSDQNGLARVHLQLPQFQAGRAALLVRATADGEEIELRKLVTPG